MTTKLGFPVFSIVVSKKVVSLKPPVLCSHASLQSHAHCLKGQGLGLFLCNTCEKLCSSSRSPRLFSEDIPHLLSEPLPEMLDDTVSLLNFSPLPIMYTLIQFVDCKSTLVHPILKPFPLVSIIVFRNQYGISNHF